jgi:hypothetical protein
MRSKRNHCRAATGVGISAPLSVCCPNARVTERRPGLGTGVGIASGKLLRKQQRPADPEGGVAPLLDVYRAAWPPAREVGIGDVISVSRLLG